jgi:hypothetical protein
MSFDEAAHSYIETLVPVGAAAAWDAVAEDSPQHVKPWDEQDGSTRARFVRAFALGLEAMSDAAGGEL